MREREEKPWISIQVKKQHYSLLVTVTLELGQVKCCQNAVYRTDLYGSFFIWKKTTRFSSSQPLILRKSFHTHFCETVWRKFLDFATSIILSVEHGTSYWIQRLWLLFPPKELSTLRLVLSFPLPWILSTRLSHRNTNICCKLHSWSLTAFSHLKSYNLCYFEFQVNRRLIF